LQAQARLRDSLISEIEDLNERREVVAGNVAEMTAQIATLTDSMRGAGTSAQLSAAVS
jgi:hypothetical protein